MLDNVSPGAAVAPSHFTDTVNAALDGVVQQLAALPGIRIVRLEAQRLLNDVVARPDAFGLTDVTNACVTTVQPFTCDRPDQVLFWDGIHPTKAAHAIIADEATSALER